MTDDRPTRPSRPGASIPPELRTPAPSRPFALLSNALTALDRIAHVHVREYAAFDVESASPIILTTRESDLVRLLVRVIADVALTLPVPRRPETALVVRSHVEQHEAVIVVDVRASSLLRLDGSESVAAIEELARGAGATVSPAEPTPGGVRLEVRVPLAVPVDAGATRIR